MTTLRSLFAYKTWADLELFDRLETAAAQLPAETLHAALRTLNHVLVADRIFRAHLSGEGHGYTATNTAATPSLGALRSAVAETDAWFERHVAALGEAALRHTLAFTFTDGDAGRMSREEMLLHVVTHGAYHRGGVGQWLEAGGVAAPRDLYTRFLHLDEPSRREAG